jgi:hypothetical protein
LINCNFILGLGGERGPGWIKQVLGVVDDVGVAYRVTKHPRDDTDLTGVENVLPSGAYKIGDQLAACSVLISRDSSLPYEAILMGRPVIYFDPFHEKERTLREDDSSLIRKCNTPEELRTALEETIREPETLRAAAPGYDPLTYLFTQPGQGSTDRVLRALHTLANHRKVYRTSDARVETGVSTAVRDWIELRARPRLRRFGPLRSLWRAARRIPR